MALSVAPLLFPVLDIAFADDGTGGSRAADQSCNEECRGDSNGVGRSSVSIDGRCPEGDRIAYEKLLRDCASLIASLARRRGVPPDRVDDVVQEVLLTVHRARATYDPRRSFEAWLRIIVERRAIDILRQMRRHGEREVHAPLAYESYADEAIDHSVRIEHKDKTKQIGVALTELPQRQREAVQHLMVDERSLADAAVLTGRSIGSLKVSLHRALNALRIKVDRGD